MNKIQKFEEFDITNESLNENFLFNRKITKIKHFLKEKMDECEMIIKDYEDGQNDEDVNKISAQKADNQLEILVQIADMLDID